LALGADVFGAEPSTEAANLIASSFDFSSAYVFYVSCAISFFLASTAELAFVLLRFCSSN
jgi:hypothetical protein